MDRIPGLPFSRAYGDMQTQRKGTDNEVFHNDVRLQPTGELTKELMATDLNRNQMKECMTQAQRVLRIHGTKYQTRL